MLIAAIDSGTVANSWFRACH